MGHHVEPPDPGLTICCPLYEWGYSSGWPVDGQYCLDFNYSIACQLFYGYYGYYQWLWTESGCLWYYCVYGAIGVSSFGCYHAGFGWIAYVTGWWRLFGMSNSPGTFPPFSTEGGAVSRIAADYAMTPLDGQVYEPDFHEGAEFATLKLANKRDKTNVLIQYDPLMMIAVPYIVSGTLDPAAAGNYASESGYNDRPSYVGPARAFFIWWDGIDSWFISSCAGDTSGPHWKLAAPCIIGDYSPFLGASGTAVVTAGPR